MAELVDAPASEVGARKGVRVRVPPRGPLLFYTAMDAGQPVKLSSSGRLGSIPRSSTNEVIVP